jgi:hypothetical protein
MSDNEPTAQEVAEAAGELAAVVEALAPAPDTYVSAERGPTAIQEMNPVWAGRAADAVRRGERPIEPRGVEKELRKRARE